MKPIRALSLFFYSILSIVVIGMTISHLWNVRKEWKNEKMKTTSLRFTLSGGSR